jgi:uncharacterized protein (TIGR03790 family)
MQRLSTSYLNWVKFFIIVVLAIGCLPKGVRAMDANEIVVVINSRMAEADDIATYYMAKRNIPPNRLIRTSLTLDETMTRADYEEDLARVVKRKIDKLRPARITTIVCIYGIPLKVAAPPMSWADEDRLQQLAREEAVLQGGEPLPAEDARRLDTIRADKKKLLASDQGAAVDSELAMILAGDYPRDGWIENPYYIGHQGRELPYRQDQVLLVARLDGPNLALVYRMINDSLEVEKTGLNGSACFDARWPRSEDQPNSGYAFYDLSLHRAATILASRMKVQIDTTEALFAPGSCPDTALYAGWYSLGNYVDGLQWQKGAIGYHMASVECSSLRNSQSSIWCVQMLSRGAAATIGPVDEPYIQAFPPPELFFTVLTAGNHTLGESYLVSAPYLSWQMILVGDPLYHPFRPPAKEPAGQLKAK